jgi:hypothetical protein
VDRLAAALARLQRRHPALGVRVVGRGWPSFTSDGVEPIPIRIVERQGDDTWRRELEREVDEPFETGRRPLARVSLVQALDRAEILLTYDHVIGDGLSGIIALGDLLRGIADPTEDSPPALEYLPLEALEPSVPWSLAGRVDDVAVMTPTGILGAATRLVRNLRLLRHSLRRVGAEFHTAGRKSTIMRSRIEHTALTEELTRQLTTAAQAHGTTTDAALSAAFLLATAAELPGLTKHRLGCVSAFSARPYLNNGVDNEFGCLIALGATSYQVRPKTSFWELAREVGERTAQIKADRSRMLAFARFLGVLGRLRSPLLFYAVCWLATGWSDVGCAAVVNLSYCDTVRRWGDLEMVDLHVATSPYWHNVLNLITVTAPNHLTWNFEYMEPFLPVTVAEAINAEIERCLREAVLTS